MKHSIRQRVLDPVTGLMLTKIQTVNGELGSGFFDRNGREIFEGDRVKVDIKSLLQKGIIGFDEFEYDPPVDNVTEVFYLCGEFILMWNVTGGATHINLSAFDLFKSRIIYLEVIGHVDD